MTVWYAAYTRQSSTQSDKCQVSHRYSYFSWWLAHSRLKHVVKINKHTKKNCAPSWLYLQYLLGYHPLHDWAEGEQSGHLLSSSRELTVMLVINLSRFLQFQFSKPNLIQLLAQEDINAFIFRGSLKSQFCYCLFITVKIDTVMLAYVQIWPLCSNELFAVCQIQIFIIHLLV
jgi:hypothetical protein